MALFAWFYILFSFCAKLKCFAILGILIIVIIESHFLRRKIMNDHDVPCYRQQQISSCVCCEVEHVSAVTYQNSLLEGFWQNNARRNKYDIFPTMNCDLGNFSRDFLIGCNFSVVGVDVVVLGWFSVPFHSLRVSFYLWNVVEREPVVDRLTLLSVFNCLSVLCCDCFVSRITCHS